MFVGREPVKRGIVDRRAMERAHRGAARGGRRVELRPADAGRGACRSPSSRWSRSSRRARSNARILVLDEPTAALADHEVELLFTLVAAAAGARASGCSTSRTACARCSRSPHRITVLKDGALVKTLPHVRDRLARAREPDGRPRARRLLPAARRARPTSATCAWRSRTCRRRCCATSACRCAPARSSASPGSRARAAPSSRARSSAPTRWPAAASRSTASRSGSARRARRSAPGSASSPRTASSRASRSRSRSPTTCCSRSGP